METKSDFMREKLTNFRKYLLEKGGDSATISEYIPAEALKGGDALAQCCSQFATHILPYRNSSLMIPVYAIMNKLTIQLTDTEAYYRISEYLKLFLDLLC